MCATIDFTDKTVSCVGDMRQLNWIIPEDAITDEDGFVQPDNYCLCGVDVEAILTANNVPFVDDVFGYTVKDSVDKYSK